MVSESAAEAIDVTILKGVVAFRVLALVWMGALVWATVATDPSAEPAIVLGALALATGGTAVTLALARDEQRLRSPPYLVLDGAASLAIALSPILAEATNNYFGGYPISWMVLVAYGHGLLWAEVAAGLLALTQVVALLVGAQTVSVPTFLVTNLVVFFVVATVVGWGFGALRYRHERWRQAQAALEGERRQRELFEQRSDLAARLHDSVLQTLKLVKLRAEDPNEVRYLARRQERELADMIFAWESEFDSSLRAELLAVAREVEDRYRIEVRDEVRQGDAELDEDLRILVEATREALVNAAQHSGSDSVTLSMDLGDDRVTVFIKDRGTGFELSENEVKGGGILHSILGRVRRHGGEARIWSQAGEGTEVELTMPLPSSRGRVMTESDRRHGPEPRGGG